MSILHSYSDLSMTDNFLNGGDWYIFIYEAACACVPCNMACYAFGDTKILADSLNLLVIMAVTSKIEKVVEVVPVTR